MYQGQENYDRLDLDTLSNVLMDPTNKLENHRSALSVLAKQPALERTRRLQQVVMSFVRHPGRYDGSLMEEGVNLLATDPDPDATLSLIELLPEVAGTALPGNTPLNEEFREYFYAALLTRQNDQDLDVWGDMLPQFSAMQLAAIVVDPQAEPDVEAIDPLPLLDRCPEPERTRALFTVIEGIVHHRGNPQHLQTAVKLLKNSYNDSAKAAGVERLAAQWESARKAGQKSAVGVLEKILGLLDTQPRTPPERLMGKRPWAP
ncbi:MAG: hypothetical protein ACFB51_04855 [Anaerolineae bacterium]